MKRVGNLIHKISCFENLNLAYYKAKKGKEYKSEIVQFSNNLTKNLKSIQNQLNTTKISVGSYHYFTIYEPKERQICAASFNERVLHHAIMNVCHPYFEKKLIFDTYATRKNKGTYKALEKARFFQKKFKWFMKFDIRKYFDNIDHAVLMSILERMFKDKKLILIFNKIITSYHTTKGKGLPIGNLTSQYFANLYLGQLDHYIKHDMQLKGYVRYMDDFVIWSNEKDELKRKGMLIVCFIETRLFLRLKFQFLNRTELGMSFLSYRIFPNKFLLSKKAKKRFKIKLKGYFKLLKNEIWSQQDFVQHANSLFAFTQKAYSKRYRKKIITYLGE